MNRLLLVAITLIGFGFGCGGSPQPDDPASSANIEDRNTQQQKGAGNPVVGAQSLPPSTEPVQNLASSVPSTLPAPSNTQESVSKKKRTLADLIAVVDKSVVRLEVKFALGRGLGSGFVVAPGDRIVTNFHVIDGAQEVKAIWVDGKSVSIQGLIYADPKSDSAVLPLPPEAQRKDFLELAEAVPRKGDPVIAFGSPSGLSFTATNGIISGIRQPAELAEFGSELECELIQTTAPISPGNSGGPLVNESGLVVGMNTFCLTSGQNLNFAVISSIIRRNLSESSKQQPKAFPIVKAQADMPEADSARKSAPKSSDRVSQFVAQEISRRKARLEELLARIDSARTEARKTALNGDFDAEREALRRLGILRGEVAELADLRSAIPVFDPSHPSSGDFGYVSSAFIKVFQILDVRTGTFLAYPVDNSFDKGRLVLFRGLDLSDTVDDELSRISEDLMFEVMGTQQYETVRGGTNTVYVIEVVGSLEPFQEKLANYRKASLRPVGLTPAEQESVRQIRAERAWHAHLADREQKASRLLELADRITKVKKISSVPASRYKEIVNEFPESTSARTAAEKLGFSKKELDELARAALDRKEAFIRNFGLLTETTEITFDEQGFRTWTTKSGTEIKGKILRFEMAQVRLNFTNGVLHFGTRTTDELSFAEAEAIQSIVEYYKLPGSLTPLEGRTDIQSLKDLDRCFSSLYGDSVGMPYHSVLMQVVGESGSKSIPIYIFTQSQTEWLWNNGANMLYDDASPRAVEIRRDAGKNRAFVDVNALLTN